MRWAAIDFETATSSRSSACAVGVVIVDEGVEVSRRAWLIRPPGNRYDPFNTRVHGLGPGDTQRAAPFDDVWCEVVELIDGRALVAHNAAFDIGVVRGCCDSSGRSVPSLRYHCTVQLARRAWPTLGRWRLPVVADHLGVALDHHDALSDAAACAAVARACIASAGASGLEALATHHGIEERYLCGRRQARSAVGSRPAAF